MTRRLRARPGARPHVLVAAGLFGAALYATGLRVPQPPALSHDAVRGAWLGVCLGLELLGVSVLVRNRRAGGP